MVTKDVEAVVWKAGNSFVITIPKKKFVVKVGDLLTLTIKKVK